jgi:hypothetical protein
MDPDPSIFFIDLQDAKKTNLGCGVAQLGCGVAQKGAVWLS